MKYHPLTEKIYNDKKLTPIDKIIRQYLSDKADEYKQMDRKDRDINKILDLKEEPKNFAQKIQEEVHMTMGDAIFLDKMIKEHYLEVFDKSCKNEKVVCGELIGWINVRKALEDA